MYENSKNEVEFREKVYVWDPKLAREARRENLDTQQKPNKKHWQEQYFSLNFEALESCALSVIE